MYSLYAKEVRAVAVILSALSLRHSLTLGMMGSPVILVLYFSGIERHNEIPAWSTVALSYSYRYLACL